jgi:hypothetical protein
MVRLRNCSGGGRGPLEPGQQFCLKIALTTTGGQFASVNYCALRAFVLKPQESMAKRVVH